MWRVRGEGSSVGSRVINRHNFGYIGYHRQHDARIQESRWAFVSGDETGNLAEAQQGRYSIQQCLTLKCEFERIARC